MTYEQKHITTNTHKHITKGRLPESILDGLPRPAPVAEARLSYH